MAGALKVSCLVLSCLLLGGLALQSKDDEHPVDKIINLLKELKNQATAEGKKEMLAYEKFAYWCKTSQKTLNKAIDRENEIIDTQQTIIDSKTAIKGVLEKQIKKLTQDMADMSTAKEKANDERTEAENLYELTNAQIEDTIQALKDALKALEGAETSTDTGFLQVRHGGLTVKQLIQKAFDMAGERAIDQAQREGVNGFLQVSNEGPEEDEATRAARRARGKARRKAAADAEATDGKTDSDGVTDDRSTGATDSKMLEGHTKKYTFKSGDIIEMLKQLLEKYENEHLEINKAETNAKNSYQLEGDARTDAYDAADASKTAKNKDLEAAKEALSDATTKKGDTEDDKEADDKTLKQNIKDCDVKRMEWEKRSETRNLEIEAMDAAVKIMAKVTGVRTEAPGNPAPPPSPVSFLQLSSSPKATDVELLRREAHLTHSKAAAAKLLQGEAALLHSKALQQVAMAVSSHLTGPSPFGKVNDMIEKMIFQLMAEQKDEDDHKNWCDKEVKKTRTSVDAKAHKMELLQDDIEDAESKAGDLADDIKDADDMVIKIEESVAEATKIRKQGKDENAVALRDAQDAQKAVANAIAVLTEFYKESGKIKKESWESFVQQGSSRTKRDDPEDDPVVLPKDPKTWETDYSGVADPKNAEDGIIALLESTLTDFEDMEANIKSQEQTDQENYDEEMSKCTIEKARRSKESEMKGNEKKRQVDKITQLKNKKKGVTKEHDATAQYLVDLEPACLDGEGEGATGRYEDRKAARKKEIDALHEAQDLLRDAFKEKPQGGGSFLAKKA